MTSDPKPPAKPKFNASSIVPRILAWVSFVYVWGLFAIQDIIGYFRNGYRMGAIAISLENEWGIPRPVAILVLPIGGTLVLALILSLPGIILLRISKFQRRRAEKQHRWSIGEVLPGVQFSMHQPVRVIAGRHLGAVGQLIEILTLTPEPFYHLKTSEGGDLYLRQSTLAPPEA